MFFRLLIFAVAGLVIYRAVRSLLTAKEHSIHSRNEGQTSQVDDVMVKDPVCGTYIAKRDGVAFIDSQPGVYFCSAECRDKYLDSQN